MNVQVNYLYRDGANYKQFGNVVFSNKTEIPITEIERSIKTALISEQYFYVNEWQFPDLHFDKWDNELDHTWHEFESIEETNAEAKDGDIVDFLSLIGKRVK